MTCLASKRHLIELATDMPLHPCWTAEITNCFLLIFKNSDAGRDPPGPSVVSGFYTMADMLTGQDPAAGGVWGHS
jgi:hypothetical protein